MFDIEVYINACFLSKIVDITPGVFVLFFFFLIVSMLTLTLDFRKVILLEWIL